MHRNCLNKMKFASFTKSGTKSRLKECTAFFPQNSYFFRVDGRQKQTAIYLNAGIYLHDAVLHAYQYSVCTILVNFLCQSLLS